MRTVFIASTATINSNNSEYITCFSNHLVFVSNWVEMTPKTASEPRSWPSLVFIRYSSVCTQLLHLSPGRRRTLSTRSWTTPDAGTPPADWWACASPPPRCRHVGGGGPLRGVEGILPPCCPVVTMLPSACPSNPENIHIVSHTSAHTTPRARVSVCVLV